MPTGPGRSIERGFAVAQVQVVAVEVSRVRQPLPVAYRDTPAALPGDQALRFKGLQGSVDVHGRQADAVGKLLLGHRQLVIRLVPQSRDLQPERELAQKMSDSGMGIPAADIGDPFPEDRSVDQRIVPHRHYDVWALETKLLDAPRGGE